MKTKFWIWWNALAEDENARWAVSRAGTHVLPTFYRLVEINVPSKTLVTESGRGVIEAEGVESVRLDRSLGEIFIRELVIS
jgi:hypothetical protein